MDEFVGAAHPRGLLPRGLGRSYGDAAQNAGGLVIETTSMDRVHDIDLDRATITVDAGMSLDTLTRALLPLGLFLPVTPGTRFVTVGGMIACDVHGKNHHRDGGFCDHVLSFVLATPMGERIEVKQEDDLFDASAGGMGLTGIITKATLALLPVDTAYVVVDTERAEDLDDCMARMEARDADYQYSVAWIDCLATGADLGRSVLTRGGHASLDQLPARHKAAPRTTSFDSRLRAPGWVPPRVLNRLTFRAFNELWFRKAPRSEHGRIQSIPSFFHPLDAVEGWNRLYGPRGFLQYQFVVPFGMEGTLRAICERISAARCPSFLAVLKRFGPGRGLLSFPIAGWTLAVDMPANASGVATLLDACDELVAEAGGRVYLAKDSRLRPELLPAMYPELDRWREIRSRHDPEGVLRSDLDRRLNLVGR